MRKKLAKVALAASFMLALAFIFSCSSDDGDTGGSSSSSGGGTSSVSSCPDEVTGDGTVSCGGQTYKTVVIGSQTWMAKNLNYNVPSSKCYDNIESNCNTYGRLYDWATAMVVCPSGWHLPSNDERDELINFVQNISGNEYSISELKAIEGWNGENGNGTDEYGFSALPGGSGGGSGSRFNGIGDSGYWWTASENDEYNAYSWIIGNGYYGINVTSGKRLSMFSVRCLKD